MSAEHPQNTETRPAGEGPVSDSASVLRILRSSFAILALAAGVMLLLLPVDRMDLWPLLRVGRDLLSGSLSIRPEGWLEFAGLRERSVHLWWAAGAAMHLAHRAHGLGSLNAFLGLVAAAGFVLQGVWLFRRHGRAYAAVVPLALLVLARPAHSLGAEVFTLAGIALLYGLLASGWLVTSGWALLWTPVLFLLWAHAHPGVVFGIICIGVECLAAFVPRAPGPAAQRANNAKGHHSLLLLLGLAVAATFAHAPLARLALLRGTSLSEYFGGPAAGLGLAPSHAGSLVLLGLSLACAVVCRKTLRPAELCRFFVLGTLAMLWAKCALLFALIAIPVIGCGCAAACDVLSGRSLPGGGGLSRFMRSQLVGLLLVVNLSLVLALTLIPRFGDAPSLGPARRLFPSQVGRFIQDSPIEGKILNSPEIGSHLVRWTRPGQILAFGSAVPTQRTDRARAVLEVLNTDTVASSVLEQYGAIVLSYPEREWDPSRRKIRAPSHLARRLLAAQAEESDPPTPAPTPTPPSTWRLVTFDDVALVFVRQTSATAELIARHDLGPIDPVDMRLLVRKPDPRAHRRAALRLSQRFLDGETPANARALYLVARFSIDAAEAEMRRIDAEWTAAFRAHRESARQELDEIAGPDGTRSGPVDGAKETGDPGDAASPFASAVKSAAKERMTEKERIRRESMAQLRALAERHLEAKFHQMAELIKSARGSFLDLPVVAPQMPESHYLKALGLLRIGSPQYFREALGHLEEALRLDPDYVLPRVELAEALARTGLEADLLDARGHWRHVVALEPGHERGRFELARAEFALGNWARSAELLEPVRASWGTDTGAGSKSDVLLALAAAYELQDDYAKAAECIEMLYDSSKTEKLPEGDLFLQAHLEFLREARDDP